MFYSNIKNWIVCRQKELEASPWKHIDAVFFFFFWLNTVYFCVTTDFVLVLQENDPSRAPGLTAVRSLPGLMSWPATTAPTRGKRSSVAPFATNASCAATTWWSTPAATRISSPACWRGPTAAAPRVPAPSATTAAQMPPAPPSALPTRLKLKPWSHFSAP